MEKFRITYTKTDRDGSTKTCVLFDNNGQGYTLPDANEKMRQQARRRETPSRLGRRRQGIRTRLS